MDERHDLVVVGAGLAGLVAANAAVDRGIRPLVLDPHPPGGRARTRIKEGWALNTGAHALYLAGPLHGLLTTWGLPLRGGDPADTVVFGMRRRELHRFPNGAGSLLTTSALRPRSKVRFARWFARLATGRLAGVAGHSLSDALADEPTDLREVIESIVRTATFVDDPEQLDAAAALGQVALALRGVRYLDGGWQTIVDALADRCRRRGGRIEPSEVVAVAGDSSVVEVRGVDGRTVAARAVVLAAGGPDTEARLLGAHPAAPGPRAEVCAVDLLLGRPAPRQGIFGLDEPRSLTPHSAVAALAPAGRGLLSGIRYGRPATAGATTAGERGVFLELAELLGVAPGDVVDTVVRPHLVVSHRYPLAAAGGLAGRPTVATTAEQVYRAGDWVGATGLLADAAAASALAAVDAVAATAGRRGRLVA